MQEILPDKITVLTFIVNEHRLKRLHSTSILVNNAIISLLISLSSEDQLSIIWPKYFKLVNKQLNHVIEPWNGLNSTVYIRRICFCETIQVCFTAKWSFIVFEIFWLAVLFRLVMLSLGRLTWSVGGLIFYQAFFFLFSSANLWAHRTKLNHIWPHDRKEV